MNKWLIVAVFVLLVLASAMGLKSLTAHAAVANGSTASPVMLATGRPVPHMPPAR